MAKTTGRSRCSTPSAPIKRRSIAGCASSRSSHFLKVAPSTARPTTTPSRWTTWPIGWPKFSEASERRYYQVKVGLKHPLFLTSDNVLFPRLDTSQTSNLDSVVSSSSPSLDARPRASIISNDCYRPRADTGEKVISIESLGQILSPRWHRSQFARRCGSCLPRGVLSPFAICATVQTALRPRRYMQYKAAQEYPRRGACAQNRYCPEAFANSGGLRWRCCLQHAEEEAVGITEASRLIPSAVRSQVLPAPGSCCRTMPATISRSRPMAPLRSPPVLLVAPPTALRCSPNLPASYAPPPIVAALRPPTLRTSWSPAYCCHPRSRKRSTM